MIEAKIYNKDGQEIGEEKLNPKIFEVELNKGLIHQIVIALRANQRKVIAHTKDRSEVRGGGRKPWRQKGTGRARHGSSRSPLWVGGGVTFGPTKDRNFSKKINKKMKKKALFMVLSDKAQDKKILLLDRLPAIKGRTKEMVAFLNQLPCRGKKVYIVLEDKNQNIIRSVQNLKNVWAQNVNSLHILDLLKYSYLVMPKNTLKLLEKIYLK